MWMETRPQRPRWKEKLERFGVRFCRVQEKVEDMEILINTPRAGFAQGSMGCRAAGGRGAHVCQRCSRSPAGAPERLPPRRGPASATPDPAEQGRTLANTAEPPSEVP